MQKSVSRLMWLTWFEKGAVGHALGRHRICRAGARPNRRDELALVAAQGHPLVELDKVRFEDRLDFDTWTCSPASPSPALLARAAAQAGKMMRFRVMEAH